MPLCLNRFFCLHQYFPPCNCHITLFYHKQDQHKLRQWISWNQIRNHHTLHSLICHRIQNTSDLADTVKGSGNSAVQNICCRSGKNEQYKYRTVLSYTISLKYSKEYNCQTQSKCAEQIRNRTDLSACKYFCQTFLSCRKHSVKQLITKNIQNQCSHNICHTVLFQEHR